MTNYIYDSRGSAVGFWRDRHVYAMNGKPVGQLNGSQVHKLSGQYVGGLYENMIVDKWLGNLGNIGNPGNPGNPGSPGNPGNRVWAHPRADKGLVGRSALRHHRPRSAMRAATRRSSSVAPPCLPIRRWSSMAARTAA